MSDDTRDLDNREFAKRMRAKRGVPEPEVKVGVDFAADVKEGDTLEVEDPKSLAAILGKVRKETTREGKVAPRVVPPKPIPCSSTDRLGKRCVKAQHHSGACVYSVVKLREEKKSAREILLAKRRTVGLSRLGNGLCPVDGAALRTRAAGHDPSGNSSHDEVCSQEAYHCDGCGLDFDKGRPFGIVLEAIVKVDKLGWSADLKGAD